MQAARKNFVRIVCAAMVVGGVSIITTQASAAENRPTYCPDEERDRRADDYRRDSRYDRDRRYSDRRYSRRHPRSEVVFRRNIDLRRYNAYVTVVEEKYWTRSGRVQRVCSVLVRGPESYYVPKKRLRRAANRNCSDHARIQFL